MDPWDVVWECHHDPILPKACGLLHSASTLPTADRHLQVNLESQATTMAPTQDTSHDRHRWTSFMTTMTSHKNSTMVPRHHGRVAVLSISKARPQNNSVGLAGCQKLAGLSLNPT
jgi:hypothetical protein